MFYFHHNILQTLVNPCATTVSGLAPDVDPRLDVHHPPRDLYHSCCGPCWLWCDKVMLYRAFQLAPGLPLGPNKIHKVTHFNRTYLPNSVPVYNWGTKYSSPSKMANIGQKMLETGRMDNIATGLYSPRCWNMTGIPLYHTASTAGFYCNNVLLLYEVVQGLTVC